MTIEELRAEADSLSEAVGRAIDEEREREKFAAARFETHISEIIASGAKDRETAIRWDMDALGVTQEEIDFYGMDWYGYHHGLAHHYFEKKEEA
jgi:hypothetical protein